MKKTDKEKRKDVPRKLWAKRAPLVAQNLQQAQNALPRLSTLGNVIPDILTLDEKIDLLIIKIDTIINYFKLKELADSIKEENDKTKKTER